MIAAFLFVALAFGLALIARVGAARRAALAVHWPALTLAAISIFALARGALWTATAFAVIAGAAWLFLSTAGRRTDPGRQREMDADAAACAVLGVSQSASEQEIRAAFRAKMARAHPDRGGNNTDAAKLTAARDRLLRRRPIRGR